MKVYQNLCFTGIKYIFNRKFDFAAIMWDTYQEERIRDAIKISLIDGSSKRPERKWRDKKEAFTGNNSTVKFLMEKSVNTSYLE